MQIMNKKILVIDDNTEILFVIQEALQLKGYDVVTKETYSGAREIERMSPDMIYLDVSLLNRDGREIARQLKRNPGTKNIPIIMLTAHTNAEALSKEACADGFLTKPFELSELWDKTEEHTAFAAIQNRY